MEYLSTILAGIATAIPLLCALINYIQKAIKEKNWNRLLALILNLMEEAETKFDNGADRKQWVLLSIKSMSDTINYNVDIDEVSKLIDELCAMSKVVNS